MSMITAAAWVPQGVAAQHPTRYAVDDEEIARISELAQAHLDEAREGLQRVKAEKSARDQPETNDSKKQEADSASPEIVVNQDLADDLKEYQLDDYDAEDPDAPVDGGSDEAVARLNVLGNVRSLAYYEPGDEDPYITLPDKSDADEDDDDERAELEVRPTDNLLVVAKVVDEVAQLEVYVYEDADDNLYVHHDLMLPAIPLCVERLSTAPPAGSGRGSGGADGRNYAAVGTFDPDIEIWDLDAVDCMYPRAILGASSSSSDPGADPSTAAEENGAANGDGQKKKKKKKKKKRSKKANDAYHVDAVLALAANGLQPHLLASASADRTVKLWDLNSATCAHSYSFHTDKACSLAWHPRDAPLLLSGSYDRTVVAADVRAPAAAPARWAVAADVDAVRWDPHAPDRLYATTEAGVVSCFDRRAAPADPADAKPLWQLQAHDAGKGVSAFDVNAHVPDFFATGAPDRSVKLWRVDAARGPSLVVERAMGLGRVFALGFAPDVGTAFRLAVGGSKGVVRVWDTSTNAAVRRAFAGRAGWKGGAEGEERAERVVGVLEDSESDESDEDEEDGGHGGGGDGYEDMDED